MPRLRVSQLWCPEILYLDSHGLQLELGHIPWLCDLGQASHFSEPQYLHLSSRGQDARLSRIVSLLCCFVPFCLSDFLSPVSFLTSFDTSLPYVSVFLPHLNPFRASLLPWGHSWRWGSAFRAPRRCPFNPASCCCFALLSCALCST